MQQITDTERAILDLYSLPFRHEGTRIRLLRERTGLTEVRAIQELNRLIDTERALKYDPITTNRLRRLRDHRQRSRSTRRLAV